VRQSQFLEVLDRDEAERRWRAAIDTERLAGERLSIADALGRAIADALGRVLAENVRAEVDVPGFDRSNMDGFAVRAEDTYGASETQPVRLRLNAETIPTAVAPQVEVAPGTATSIATGGMLPRGADAVVPVEVTDVEAGMLVVRRACVPGSALSFAGTDIGHRSPRRRSRAPAPGRDPVDGRRARAARRGHAAGPRLRQQRAHPRRRRPRAGR
jgi:putative molybdopterin biosynthesis protein